MRARSASNSLNTSMRYDDGLNLPELGDFRRSTSSFTANETPSHPERSPRAEEDRMIPSPQGSYSGLGSTTVFQNGQNVFPVGYKSIIRSERAERGESEAFREAAGNPHNQTDQFIYDSVDTRGRGPGVEGRLYNNGIDGNASDVTQETSF